MLAPVPAGKPFPLKDEDGDGLDLPSGLSRPVLAVPAVNPVRCFAVSLYGPHASGTDLDVHERGMLARLAAEAAAMYAELENSDLRGEIARLERKLDAAKPAPQEPGATGQRKHAWRSMSLTGRRPSFPPTGFIGSRTPRR